MTISPTIFRGMADSGSLIENLSTSYAPLIHLSISSSRELKEAKRRVRNRYTDALRRAGSELGKVRGPAPLEPIWDAPNETHDAGAAWSKIHRCGATRMAKKMTRHETEQRVCFSTPPSLYLQGGSTRITSVTRNSTSLRILRHQFLESPVSVTSTTPKLTNSSQNISTSQNSTSAPCHVPGTPSASRQTAAPPLSVAPGATRK